MPVFSKTQFLTSIQISSCSPSCAAVIPQIVRVLCQGPLPEPSARSQRPQPSGAPAKRMTSLPAPTTRGQISHSDVPSTRESDAFSPDTELRARAGQVASTCFAVARRAVDATRSQPRLRICLLSSSLARKAKALCSAFLTPCVMAIPGPPRGLRITSSALFPLLSSTPQLSEGFHQEGIEKHLPD